MIARVAALIAGVLAISIGLVDWFSEPQAASFGDMAGPSFQLPTTTLLWVLIAVVAAAAAWRRDFVVLVAALGVLVFLWWARPESRGYEFVSRQEYEAMRGSFLTSTEFIAGMVLLLAGAASALRQRVKAR